MSHLFVAPKIWIVTCLCIVSAACSASRAACELSRVEVEQAQPQRHDQFVGHQGRMELVFHNEKRGGPVDAFPEPPLIVRNVDTKQECRIEEGGIWVRGDVFLSTDGKTLMVREYSGSNDWLAFYETSNCMKVGEIDISNAKWKLRSPGIAVGQTCSGDDIESCQSLRTESLDAACRPLHSSGKAIR